jgi:putative ABC transport system permease protein
MTPVWMRLRAEVRGHWRAWLGLVVMLGLFGGAVIAAAAGARRTDSAYPRFLREHKAITTGVPVGFFDPCCIALTFEDIKSLPQVVDAVRWSFFFGTGGLAASDDPRLGRTIDSFKVLQGRMPDPNKVDEVIIPFDLARQRHWRLGTVLRTQPQGPKGPVVKTRVVGIGANAGSFPPYLGDTPTPFGTPAYFKRYAKFVVNGQNGFNASLLLLRHGDADLDAFHASLNRLGKGKVGFTFDQIDHTINVNRSFHLQAIALWLLAGMAAIATLMVFGQTLARQTFLESTEYPTLRALGMSREQLLVAGMSRALAVGVGGAVLATLVAFGLSPLMPTGLARVAEPSPGLRFDVTMIGLGAAAILLLTVAIALWPAWRAARVSGSMLGVAEIAGAAKPSAAVTTLARTGFPPTAVAGVKLALEPGSGRTAVPVRTTLLGVTLGIAALATAFSFSTSLTHLLGTPRLYGQNWDASFFAPFRTNLAKTLLVPELARDRRVEAIGIGTTALPMTVDRLRLGGIGMDRVRGKVTPPIRTGREPRTRDEIVLGTKTLEKLGKKVGDNVMASIQGASQTRMRVVGTAVIPPVGTNARLGEGAAFRYGALGKLCQCDVPPEDTVLVRFRQGVDKAAAIRELRARFRREFREQQPEEVVSRPERPTDLVNFGRVQSLPVILAGLLAALAAAVLGHALVTSIRRRRRDLAVLKTLGFVRGQVRRTVAWQATVFASISLLVGVPLGVAGGRWLWTAFANQLGIVPEPVVPALPLLLAVPATVLFANVIASLPAGMAARTQPALALRTE